MREQGKQRKLIDRWAEDKNPVGTDPNYKYDKSLFDKPVEFEDCSGMTIAEVLERDAKRKAKKAKKSDIDCIEEV